MKKICIERKIDDDLSTWINLKHYESEIEDLVDKDLIIIKGKSSITIKFDYPLKNSVIINFPINEEGLKKADLIRIIGKQYDLFYQEENETSDIIEGPHDIQEYNRNSTNGKWGIWGHFQYQLDLSCIYETNDYYILSIDS